MAYQYYLLSKPPGPGCQPPDFLEKESWLPRRFPVEFARGAFGIVTYPDPLAFDQIDTYDLFPLDLLEQVIYVVWIEAGEDESITHFILDSYWCLSDGELAAKVAQEDYTAIDIKRLKDHGYAWPQVLARLFREAANV